MLRQRVITAFVLMCFLLPALFAPVVWPFAMLTLLAIAVAAWEWGRLNGAGAVSLLLGIARDHRGRGLGRGLPLG